MSWRPLDLASTCAVYTTITTCQPQTFVFLQLVINLFGYSKDATETDYDFSQENHREHFEDFFKFNSFGGFNEPDVHQQQQEFDFIVIGAGSAGCVVANRLSEVPKWKVLLLEAGDEEPEVASVPSFSPMLQDSSIDWGYRTQPQQYSCLARAEQRCPWARGKVMGGSSTINYMIYIRGTPRDYDKWAEMGNKGWSYKEVLPYFIKSENNRNPEHIDTYFHGFDGYQSVETYPYQDQPTLATIDAYQEVGLPFLDQNGKRQIGTMLLQHTVKNGRRASTNVAFIRPIRRKRSNLVIQTQATVLRVLIDKRTKTAFGVEYTRKGQLIRAYAKKEVIVSAGPFNSPKILMVSGVGPADHLYSRGIDVIKDLAVGYNLHDHTTIDGVVFALSNYSATTVSDQQMEQDVYRYEETNRGPLSATGALQANAFFQTKYEREPDQPDIQISMDSTNVQNFFTDPLLTAQTAVLPSAYYDGMMVRPILLSPVSRGVVQLNDTDPINGDPLIYANTFSERIDLLRIVQGIRQSFNLLHTKAYRHLGVRLVSTPLPDCDHIEWGTDEYWECVAQSYTTTIFHPVGTCKMGPKNDRSAVVDPELRVYGIKNLRVIDSSIMPVIIRGNTNAPTIMIAEKGSDYIKKTWLGKKNSRLHFTDKVTDDFSYDFFKK